MSAEQIRTELGQHIWDSYFKFCAVRNPFDMLVSLYWFELSRATPATVNQRSPVEGFREWLANGIPVIGRAQSSIDGNFCLDYYIRYESLQADVAAVCRHIGLSAQPHTVPRYKTGMRDPGIKLTKYYTPSLQAQVEEAYAPELEEFGYRLSP